MLKAPDGVFNVNSLSGTGAVSPQGTYRPSNVMDRNSEFHIRHRVALPSESVQQPNHQPRFQPNATYGASNQTEVLGMFRGLRAFQSDHRTKSKTAHAPTANALNTMRMGWFYINPRGVSTSCRDQLALDRDYTHRGQTRNCLVSRYPHRRIGIGSGSVNRTASSASKRETSTQRWQAPSTKANFVR